MLQKMTLIKVSLEEMGLWLNFNQEAVTSTLYRLLTTKVNATNSADPCFVGDTYYPALRDVPKDERKTGSTRKHVAFMAVLPPNTGKSYCMAGLAAHVQENFPD